jgi:hypothetical protein
MRNALFARRTRKVKLFAVSAAVLSTAALMIAGATAGEAITPITPTGISAAASTDNSGLGGAVPTVLTSAGAPSDHPFTLTITLLPTGAAFKSDTVLSLSAPGPGTLDPAAVTMPGGVNSASFSVSYSAVANGVSVTVSGPKARGKTPSVAPGTTNSFDVLKTLTTFAPDNPNLKTGLGVGNADCSQTTTEPECGILILPSGFASTEGLLSLGACTPDLGCSKGTQVVQFLADLGTTYSPDNPATLIIRCDKSLCRGGSIAKYTVKYSQAATGALSTAAPCVNKGVALDANGTQVCTDYVQSHRDNSGDTLLYLLFTHDMRGAT